MMGSFNKNAEVSNVFGFSRNGDTCMATIRDLGSFEFAAVDGPHVIHRLRQAANAIEQSMAAAEKLGAVTERQRLDAINRYNGKPAETKAAREDKKLRQAIDRVGAQARSVEVKETPAERRARIRAKRRAK